MIGRKQAGLTPARIAVRAALPVLPCRPPAGIADGTCEMAEPFARLDDLEAILRVIEERKGSPVQRVHPGLIMREMVAAARDGGRSNE